MPMTYHAGGASKQAALADRRRGDERLGRLAEIVPADQLEDQLIERDIGLLVRAREADQLAIQIHGIVACLAVVDDLFAVHARASFQTARGLLLPFIVVLGV